MPRTFLIDTDTASDDAVALIMALRHDDVQVAAITTVSGNAPLAQATTNALYTVELCGADVPVYAGASRPLLREPVHAFWFHGNDGFGDMNYPAPQRQAADGHAVDVIIETVRANPGIEIVTLGPLTNVALAVSRAPDIIAHVARCVVMGGVAVTIGNVSPAAEYNIWCDPEAARIVFLSGLPVEMVGWELSRHQANLLPDEMAEIRAFGTALGDFALDCNRRAYEASQEQSGDPGLDLPDPVAMAVALDPTICTRQSKHYVDIETHSDLTRGMVVIDQLGVTTDERNRAVWEPIHARGLNVTICWEIDIPRWKAALYQALK